MSLCQRVDVVVTENHECLIFRSPHPFAIFEPNFSKILEPLARLADNAGNASQRADSVAQGLTTTCADLIINHFAASASAATPPARAGSGR
jgi:hypothetical protein